MIGTMIERRPSSIWLAAAAALLWCGCNGAARGAPETAAGERAEVVETTRTIGDAKITAAVQRRIALDPAVPGEDLTVRTTTAVVTLSGEVPHLRAVERAVQIAEATRGVRAVVERIDVRPARRSDGAIRQEVLGALRTDPVTESHQLTVKVDGGKVFIGGQVESWSEARLAEDVVEQVRGVAAVENRIHVLHRDERSDREIREEVRRLLDNNARVMAELLTVHVNNGHVRLVGTVCSAAERTRARRAGFVQGVQSVDVSAVAVTWVPCREMRRAARPLLTDDAVEKALGLALSYDPRVKPFNVTASVARGVATLRGEVDNLKAKLAAEEDTRNTVGVVRVDNLLVVKPRWQITDSELEQNVQAAIVWNPYLSLEQIDVAVSDGAVTLRGELASHFDRELALDVVSRIRGVGSIIDELNVDRGKLPPDWTIERRVRQQLAWNPWLEQRQIEIEVEDGVATLSGQVATWYERNEATREAHDAGAWRVENELRVSSRRAAERVSSLPPAR